jgi:hypothetical protein
VTSVVITYLTRLASECIRESGPAQVKAAAARILRLKRNQREKDFSQSGWAVLSKLALPFRSDYSTFFIRIIRASKYLNKTYFRVQHLELRNISLTG